MRNRTQMVRTLAGIACSAALLGPPAAEAQETPPSFAPVVKDLLPAVVNISTQKAVDPAAGGGMGELPPDHPLRRFFDRFGGGGTLESLFSNTAQKISAAEITTARQLYETTHASLPSDAMFREAFSGASVSKNYLARYYLRAIAASDDRTGEYRISQHHDDVNLEHVLPREPGENWPHISAEEAAGWHKRIGNLTVMDSTLNVNAANDSFDEKKAVYAGRASNPNRPRWLLIGC